MTWQLTKQEHIFDIYLLWANLSSYKGAYYILIKSFFLILKFWLISFIVFFQTPENYVEHIFSISLNFYNSRFLFSTSYLFITSLLCKTNGATYLKNRSNNYITLVVNCNLYNVN